MTKIVSIHSFRGGTGKSNVVANLAASLALQGLRIGVIDTDIQSPGIHVLFGLDLKTVNRTLNDYLQGRCRIEETAYDVGKSLTDGAERIAAAGGAIHLIPSSMKANEITTILSQGYDIRLLTSGYEELSQRLNLDFLIIDTHPGVNEETLLSIGISHVLLVILRPDYQDYQGTAVTVNVAKKLDIPKMFLLVNRALADYDPEDIRQQMETTYQIPVAGVLQDYSELARLGSRQIFKLCYPDHPLSKQFGAIATLIST
jgi:septum site-determining protein MinD